MPVLRQDDGAGTRDQRVDRGDHRIAVRDGQGAARAEVVLDVNHEQGDS